MNLVSCHVVTMLYLDCFVFDNKAKQSINFDCIVFVLIQIVINREACDICDWKSEDITKCGCKIM